MDKYFEVRNCSPCCQTSKVYFQGTEWLNSPCSSLVLLLDLNSVRGFHIWKYRELPISITSSESFTMNNEAQNRVAYSISSAAETRDRTLESFLGGMDLMMWILVVILTNGVFLVTHVGFESMRYKSACSTSTPIHH